MGCVVISCQDKDTGVVLIYRVAYQQMDTAFVVRM